MASSEIHVKIHADTRAVDIAVEALRAAIAETEMSAAARECLQRFLDRGDLGSKFVRVESDHLSAGARELRVVVYPTDFLLSLPAAIRAGNLDSLIIKE